MRPDRIIVARFAELRRSTCVQAMNTGHEGSLTTIHANSPRDALSRLETLVLTAGVDLPLRAIREQISSAFDLLIQIQRLVDGSRRITHVTEVLRMESDVITLQDIFAAKPPERGAQSDRRTLAAADRAAVHGPQASVPREARRERGCPPAELLRARGARRGPALGVLGCELRRCIRMMHRVAAVALVSLALIPAAAAAPQLRIAGTDMASYPHLVVNVVTPSPVTRAPRLEEEGVPATALQAVNLGAAKSVVVAIDNSQSMKGRLDRGCRGSSSYLHRRKAARRPASRSSPSAGMRSS